MKTLKYIILIILLSGFVSESLPAQEARVAPNLNLSYFNNNSRLQYLKASAKTKVNGRFQPVPGINLRFFIANDSPSNLLGKAVTDAKGEAVILIPPSAKSEWTKSPKQNFIAVSEASASFDAANASADVTKAKIKIDTADGRNIIAILYELKDTTWVPVKGVDMRIAIKRLGGDLNVSETPTYTTDSTGAVSAEFKRDSLPADSSGNIILIAKVEDNDVYGNITSERTVPWGVTYVTVSNFDERTLYARRGHSPLWLELMAYSIGVAVWAVLLYLILQIRKLKRLGT